ncbi:MAG: hypothetical protein WAN00_02725 [Trebonia sp.]
MTVVARYPDSTKTSLEQRLRARARERWPQIASLQIRHRGAFSYVDATLTDATTLKLCRLRYVGSAHDWQFAVYRASHDDYDESVFFTGLPVGTCQDALDTACGLYLNDPTAWTRPPTNLRARPLSRIRGLDFDMLPSRLRGTSYVVDYGRVLARHRDGRSRLLCRNAGRRQQSNTSPDNGLPLAPHRRVVRSLFYLKCYLPLVSSTLTP